MSEKSPTVLESYLDDLLTTIPARAGRKQQMRAELLAHLFCIFDEELAERDDEQAAIDATLARFGAAADLRDDLDAAVPRAERVISWLLGKKESVMWRLFMILGVVVFLVGFGFVCPALAQLLSGEVVGLSVALLILGTVLCLGAVWSFVHGVRRFRVRNL
jgi:hypothetical protein